MKKQILTTLMVSTMVLSSVVVPMTSKADRVAESDKKIAELSLKEAAANSELSAVRSTIEDIQSEAEALQNKQQKLTKQTEKLSKEISNLTKRIEKRDQAIKDQARSVQIDGQGTGFVEAVLNAETVSDVLTRVAAATRLVGAGNDLMAEQKEDKEAVETKKVETEEKVDALTENAVALEAKKGELVSQELQQSAMVNTLSAEKATEKNKKESYIAEAAAAEKAIKEQAAAVAAANKAAEVKAEEAAKEETTQTEAVKEETTQTEAAQTEAAQTEAAQTEAPQTEAPQTEAPQTEAAQTEAPQTEAPAAPQAPKPQAPKPAAPAPSGNGSAILAEAAKHVGKPYVWGAKGPDSFDCSGFTAYVYRKVTGREIGGYTVPQESAGATIAVSQAQPGDLLFWGSHGGTYHVAISTGGGGYIHAPAPGQGVSYSSVSYFAPDFAVRM